DNTLAKCSGVALSFCGQAVFSHLGTQLKLVEDDLLLLKSNLLHSKPFMMRPSGRNSPTSQYCAPSSRAATGPAPFYSRNA
ncbi:hypothetical protein, partial [Halomonas sp. TD01]|uniref:hypothetical protein n=1 Tax=Halomonas sp. TD01 TaxID=999141 RepID=UPI000214F4E9